jgi:hypothetical protein
MPAIVRTQTIWSCLATTTLVAANAACGSSGAASSDAGGAVHGGAQDARAGSEGAVGTDAEAGAAAGTDAGMDTGEACAATCDAGSRADTDASGGVSCADASCATAEYCFAPTCAMGFPIPGAGPCQDPTPYCDALPSGCALDGGDSSWHSCNGGGGYYCSLVDATHHIRCGVQ